MGNLLHKPQKFYNNVFLLVGYTTLRTLVNFVWLIQGKFHIQGAATSYFYNIFTVQNWYHRC